MKQIYSTKSNIFYTGSSLDFNGLSLVVPPGAAYGISALYDVPCAVRFKAHSTPD